MAFSGRNAAIGLGAGFASSFLSGGRFSSSLLVGVATGVRGGVKSGDSSKKVASNSAGIGAVSAVGLNLLGKARDAVKRSGGVQGVTNKIKSGFGSVRKGADTFQTKGGLLGLVEEGVRGLATSAKGITAAKARDLAGAATPFLRNEPRLLAATEASNPVPVVIEEDSEPSEGGGFALPYLGAPSENPLGYLALGGLLFLVLRPLARRLIAR